MSAHTRSGVRSPKVAASVAAGAMLVTLGFGLTPTHASESPSPAPSPTTTEDDHATNPDFTPPETVDTYVGQSVQARKNADGVQNASLANFRWTVTQVNAESLNGLDVSVPLPMTEAPGLRSLTGRANSPTEVDGGVLFGFDNVDGIQTKRTLNLWPQDKELPVDVTAEFTLDGERVNAQDIVGKGGLVTATYTIINKSVKNENVNFENVKGEDDTEAVDTSQAFVGISKQFIPQSWAQFDPGHGIYGADGRGNFQTQWITLAFLPFAENGEASFGWSAVIPDGQGFIPKMVIEVSPLYVPAHEEGVEEETASSSNGVPRPNMDAATASVQSGVEDLIAGVSSLADTIGQATGVTKEGISIAVSQIKAALAELCAPELLYCDDPTVKPPLTQTLEQLLGQLTGASEAIGDLLESLASGQAPDLDAILDGLNSALASATQLKSDVDQQIQEDQAAYDQNCAATPNTPQCLALKGSIEANKKLSAGLEDQVIPTLNRAINAVDTFVSNFGNLDGDVLRTIKALIDGLIPSLQSVLDLINALKPPLDDLNAGIDAIGAAIDAGGAILGDVGSSLDQISSGKAQISAGLGMAGDDISAYIADVVAVAKAAAESGKEVAAEIEAHANQIKAQLAGLKGRMAESPLPYGGGYNTVYAPAGDPEAVQTAATAMLPNTTLQSTASGVVPTAELFGAYQFMLDPADSNKPNTPWRILLSVLFVVGAGFLGKRVASRGKA